MNDKDKETFEKWIDNDVLSHDENNKFKNMSEQERVIFITERTWQAACEYKDKAILNGSKMKQMNDRIEDLITENKKLREALELTIKTAEYVYQPDKPLEKGLPPFHYHTLTYEGDLELIEKTIAARKLLDSTKE
jgi:hypothetical protein